MENQAIVFAVYKNNEFKGFRQDTFGTLGSNWAKIYTYSKSQVETVIKNMEHNLKPDAKTLGSILGSDTLDASEKAIDKKYQDMVGFEVRVLKGPSSTYEKNFDVVKAEYVEDTFPTYNQEEFKTLLQNPDDAEVIETHHFALQGVLNLS